jgi:ribosomal protein S6--L-glutamate ligase
MEEPELNIGILSRDRNLYTVKRLMEAANEAGHRPVFLNIVKCALFAQGDKLAIYYSGKKLARLDVVLPRVGTNITKYGIAVVRHFEEMGTPVVNSSKSIMISRDKFATMQVFARRGIPIPRTVLLRTTSGLDKIINLVGDTPCILKTNMGTQGIGVMLAESPEAAQSILEAVWALSDRDIQIQAFIGESRGKDIRALVVGDEVVAAMERVSTTGFRSNIHRGALGRLIHLDDEQYEVAIKAARALGLHVAGIDMIATNDGPVVLEGNSSPGFEGLEAATEKDIAATIIRYVIEYAERRRTN